MPDSGLVLVVRDASYGSAVMRGLQQAQTLNECGIPTRLLSVESDRSSLLSLRDSTVVLVKYAVVENELVLALSVGGNRLIWDVVDYLAHKPPIDEALSPAEHLRSLAASDCVHDFLVMTRATEPILTDAFPEIASIHHVDHQVDRALIQLPAIEPPTSFGLAYLGAPENVPDWVPELEDLHRLLTSERQFSDLIDRAREIPFHVDFRNPARDRRDLKPWTKVATAVRLGAAVIAESTEANRTALGHDYPLFFDGTRLGFNEAVERARQIWNEGRWPELRRSLDRLNHEADPHVVAARLAEALGATAAH